MKRLIKRIILILLTLLLLAGIIGGIYFKDRLWLLIKYFERGKDSPIELAIEKDPEFAKDNGFDLEHAVLIDFGRHSGKNRFFVWNFKENRVEIESLVAHGYGNTGYESTNQEIVFSNVPNSYTSSLGKYRLGARSWSQWGINIHYKMHGLESTNDKAYERYVVLHSFKRIPDSEIYPAYLPMGFSQGCPVIDDETMREVDALLQTKEKPVLMWIYYLE